MFIPAPLEPLALVAALGLLAAELAAALSLDRTLLIV